jgi:hypothetical protein
VFGDYIRFSDPPTLVPTVVSAEKQLTMPPHKKSKKNTLTETDQEDHYNEEDNEISFTAEPSQSIDQEQRAKLEALQKERVLKVKIRQPSHEFTFGVGMNFIPYPLVLTPVV